jgi:hypothetical protein
MNIPDTTARYEETELNDYWCGYLTDNEKAKVSVYKAAIEDLDTLFDNLEVFYEDFHIKGEDINLISLLENHPAIRDKFREVAKEWLQNGCNSMVTAMLDDMPDDVYNKIKEKMDAKQNPQWNEKTGIDYY